MESSPLFAPLGIALALVLGGLLIWMRRRIRAIPEAVILRAEQRRARRMAERDVADAPDAMVSAEVPHRRAGIEVAELSRAVVDIDALLAEIERSERRRAASAAAVPAGHARPSGDAGGPDMVATFGAGSTAQREPAPEPHAGPDAATRRWQQTELLAAAVGTVPLPDLVLAWCEARGYRVFEASRSVHPVRAVLRHKKDPSHAYAFVIEDVYVDRERLAELRAHAEAIGLPRMMIVTLDGHQLSLAHGKDIRLVDRATMEHQLHRVDLPIAAKIVWTARQRARGATPG